MSVVTELESVGSFVSAVVPKVALKYDVPKQPTKDTLVVRVQSSSPESETRYHYRIDRDYQIVVYGVDSASALTKMGDIERVLNDKTMLIPVKGSTRYIRIGAFSFSMTFATEGGLSACIAVLSTEVREARTQEQYDKIMHVYGRIEAR
ncbi:hypothetical protein EEL30_15825 [Brevibacillus laterosporus]|uniref:Uncharacterized protein n=1 Tax=Brevibacillus laterosporus TaxID=1465 RepID=A0A518V9G1_BRELA|nr:hypothetical protein EEL30_15825 [Brevibacillus laterosporus]